MGTATITGRGYALDAVGRRTGYMDGTASNAVFTYDPAVQGSPAPCPCLASPRAWQHHTHDAYNLRDQVTGMTYSDGTPAVTMSYDAAGRHLKIGNAVATDAYAYDNDGRLAVETQSVAGHPAGMRTLTHSARSRTALTMRKDSAPGWCIPAGTCWRRATPRAGNWHR